MNVSSIPWNVAGNVTDDVFSNVTNITEHSVRSFLDHFVISHINVTYDIVKGLGNITEETATGLINATDDVGICDFIKSNVTSGNVTTTVTSYNPAACGVYGLYPPIKPLLIFILVCFTIWASFGNGCLLGVIATDKNMQEPGNIFLCALAIADIVLSVVYTPMAIYSLVHGEHPGGGWCRMQAFLTAVLGNLSIYLQTSLWICRYVHIAHPYKYQEMLTRGRFALVMAFCFLIALAPPLVGLARAENVLTWTVNLFSVDIAEPVSLMVPCVPGGPESTASLVTASFGVILSCRFAGLIYREARKSQKKHDQKLAWQAQADKLESKIKAAKTLGIVVGVQWVTWIPAIIGGFLRTLGGITIATDAIYGDITYVIYQTSTFSDSIVYAFRNKIYRRALTKIFRKIRNAINDF